MYAEIFTYVCVCVCTYIYIYLHTFLYVYNVHLVHAVQGELRVVAPRVECHVLIRDSHDVHAVDRRDSVVALLPMKEERLPSATA